MCKNNNAKCVCVLVAAHIFWQSRARDREKDAQTAIKGDFTRRRITFFDWIPLATSAAASILIDKHIMMDFLRISLIITLKGKWRQNILRDHTSF